MKNLTRIASLLLALVMVLGLAATAFAEEDQQFTLTIEDHYTNHAYDVYQIFAGTVTANEDGSREISNLSWGADVTEEGKTALLTFNGNTFADVNELARYLSENKSLAEDFAAFAEEYLTETRTARITYNEGTGYQVTLPGGYYLIKNPDEMDYGIYATDLILKVVGNVNVAPKTPGPKIYKAVYNNNDSTDPEEELLKDAQGNYIGINTWDIGDTVNFTLIGTIPAGVTSYESYKYEIHDEWARGVFEEIGNREVEVYIVSQTKSVQMRPQDYSVNIEAYRGYGFVVEMDLAKVMEAVATETYYTEKFNDGKAPKNIVVKYGIELMEPSMGAHENTNRAWIEYLETEISNEVTTWTGTLQFTVHKVGEMKELDENGEQVIAPLTGAEFKLQKFMQADDGAESVTFTYGGQTTTYYGAWVDYQNQFTVAENGTDFTVKGLDEGIYKLVETKTPDGYVAAEDLIFKVATAENYQYGALVKLAVYTEDGTEDIFSRFGNQIETPEGYIMDATRFETTVLNKLEDSFALPETGGMGTTLFYVLGAVLVLGAAVLLITKRRMNTEN